MEMNEKFNKIFQRGNNILVLGPPLSGKKTFSKRFIFDGLTKGEAGIFTCTNNTAEEESEDFFKLGFNVKSFEEKNLLVYVDFCSRNVGLKCEDTSNVRRLTSMMDLTGYNVAVRDFVVKFWKEGKPVRLVFDSVSTLLLYNELKTVVRFFHVLFGKLRNAGAIGLFLVEEGIHSTEVLTTLTSMVNAFIEIKTENEKNYVKIRAESLNFGWFPLNFHE